MLLYVLRRLGQMVVLLFIVSVGVFALVLLIPGDVATALLGESASQQDYQMLRARLGLDQPFHIRYIRWAASMLRGDLGISVINRFPVTELFAQRLPFTIQLALCGIAFAVLLGVPAGILAAVRHNSQLDMLIRGFSTFGTAMPNFWLGLLLIIAFSLRLNWLPSSGVVPIGESFFGWLRSMILPAVTIGLRFAAIIVRQTRSAFLDVIRADYVRTARAKGVAGLQVITRHVLRNALIPVVTVIGLQLGRLIGGAVVTEMIFQIPGMGGLIADSVFSRDLTVVQGGVMVVTVGVLGINLIVDILYGIIDPRIRLGSPRSRG